MTLDDKIQKQRNCLACNFIAAVRNSIICVTLFATHKLNITGINNLSAAEMNNANRAKIQFRNWLTSFEFTDAQIHKILVQMTAPQGLCYNSLRRKIKHLAYKSKTVIKFQFIPNFPRSKTQNEHANDLFNNSWLISAFVMRSCWNSPIENH